MRYAKGKLQYIGDTVGDFMLFASEAYIANVGSNFFQMLSENPKTEIIAFDTDKANADRLVLCLNEHDDLVAQRDELLAILKPFAEFQTLIDITRNKTTITFQDFLKARQAIKNAKVGNTK